MGGGSSLQMDVFVTAQSVCSMEMRGHCFNVQLLILTMMLEAQTRGGGGGAGGGRGGRREGGRRAGWRGTNAVFTPPVHVHDNALGSV